MDLSQELTLYTGQNLTLSCQPRDSPKHLVYWYKGARSQKGHEKHFSTGPSFTITKATVDDTAFYSCSAAEWGFWGIRHYVLVNVIEPGKRSCANGWSLYKNSCFMNSARTVLESWFKAYDYCNKSSARLAKVSSDQALRFVRDLAKQVNASRVWIGSQRGAHFRLLRDNSHSSQSGKRRCVKIDGIKRTLGKCTDKLSFICERVLPGVAKDVIIEHINSSTVRVGWSMPASSDTVVAYHVELSTSNGNVVTWKSSSKERSLLLTHLQPNIDYRVRVQAENAAGNGSSSSYVPINAKGGLPIIVTSTQNTKVIAGHSITLQCGQSHQDITWYKDESAIPLARGQAYSIDIATAADEGMYYCAVDNGPRGSVKVLVIDKPVISYVNGSLLRQHDKGQDKRELLLLCDTANRHPPAFAWRKDGTPLAKGTDTIKISLEENTAFGEYECHVTNLAGNASRSLVISPVAEPVELQVTKSSSASLVWIIAVLSVLLAVCCVVTVSVSSIGKRILKISKPRKMTTQSITSTEMVTIEDVDSPGPVSRTANVTRDNDEVFPYDVIQTWTGANGTYMSLDRRDNNDEHQEDVTQVLRPDYANISPSNRNDSAANCMYAPLRLTTVVAGSNTSRRPYVNVDSSETSSDM